LKETFLEDDLLIHVTVRLVQSRWEADERVVLMKREGGWWVVDCWAGRKRKPKFHCVCGGQGPWPRFLLFWPRFSSTYM
jgi:hypothetical protein